MSLSLLVGVLGTTFFMYSQQSTGNVETVAIKAPDVQPVPEQNTEPAPELDTETYRTPAGRAVLYGRINHIADNAITFKLVEWVLGADNQEQAAIEEGKCTLERVEQDTCWPANFYMRSTDKTLTLPLAKKPIIRVMARNSPFGFRVDENDSIHQETIDVVAFTRVLNDNDFSIIPFIITTSNGTIISIEEQYLP